MFTKKISIYLLALAVLLTLGIAIFPPLVIFDYDFESFFPQEDEELSFYQDFRNRFENDNDYLLIALGQEPDIFDSAFLSASNSLNESLKNLEKVERTISLLDLADPIINPFGIRYQKVLSWENPGDLDFSKKSILRSNQYLESLISEDGGYLLIILKNQQGISKKDGDVLYNEIEKLVSDSGISNYHLAGKIRAQGEFVQLMQEEFSLFLGISIAMIVLLLIVIFRTWWGVVVPVVVLMLGILWTISFSLYFGKPLDVMSVMQPTILSVVGLAGLIHFFNHYLAQIRNGFPKNEAVQKCFSELWMAVFLTCFTTALGFFSLYFTNIPSLKFFGLYTGIGVMLMFLAVMMVAPGLLYLLTPFKVSENDSFSKMWRKWMRKAFLWTISNTKPIVGIFILVTLMSSLAMSRLQVNGFILDDLPEKNLLIAEFRFFDREFGGSKPLEFSLESGPAAKNLVQYEVLREQEKLEGFVREVFGASQIISPLTFAKTVNKAVNGGNEKAFITPSKGQIQRILPYVDNALEKAPVKILTSNLRSGRLSTRTEDMGSYESSIMKAKLSHFLETEINPDLLKVRITGTSHLIDISHESVTSQLAKGLGFAFGIVALIVGFLFKSWKLAIVALIPNIIPLIWVCGMMFVLGIELKLTTAIIFTVAFGIAVDDTIHFMAKLKMELNKGKSWLYAIKRTYLETGKAIILTTLVLVLGFSVLTLSEFGVTYYSGLLIGMSLVFALVSDLVLLPVMLIFLRTGKRK
ncbi:MMPL family transporter [Aquiflexum sp. TKW24L]|uniref:efflux RND transporter permease subunit n=1 Tax=Aquiflexum sp. TKW24L TaxID=2942212 RepID=UPI0020C0E872|nr:MMPL family transporter [Aquiflexum sp. TKW24L]MCL6259997.1 MMPL family transporter [Aquiflexum sp. TKW24L]